jgi:prevent-host-death family protein
MAHWVSAREANQRFSDILDRAARGESVVITRHGKPVARLIRYEAGTVPCDEGAAWDRLMAMLEDGLHLGGDSFDREALYER